MIKEELLALTGDVVSAAMLNHLLFWQGTVNKQDEERLKQIEIFENNGDLEKAEQIKKQLRYGWFWKSAKELSEEILFSTRQTVERKMKELIKENLVEKKENP